MRRGERAIESKDGQKAILEHCRVCSLAFSGDEYPYVIPLNYGFVWNEDRRRRCCIFTALRWERRLSIWSATTGWAFCVQNEKEIKILEPAMQKHDDL